MTVNLYLIFLYKIINYFADSENGKWQVEKQVSVLNIRMFVSFSYVRLWAPLHHVLLITSLSWGPYVSHLLQQHALDFFVSQQGKDCKALLALLALQDAL